MVFAQGLASPKAGRSLDMGTRLYPATNDIATIEKLAGVPAGTKATLDRLTAEGKKISAATGDEFAVFDHIRTNQDAARLDSFITFGWGKVSYKTIAELGYDGCYGGTKNPEHVEKIAIYNEVPEEDIKTLIESGGVWWG
jgi:hypothetical protein